MADQALNAQVPAGPQLRKLANRLLSQLRDNRPRRTLDLDLLQHLLETLAAPGAVDAQIQELTRAAWEWGVSCEIDDVRWGEAGDSHNQMWRDKASQAATRLQAALLTAEPPAAAQASEKPAGLPMAQEPKYTVNGHAIVNRATGQEIPADEPVFILRARDKHAMYAMRDYLRYLPTGTAHHAAVEARVMDFFNFKSLNMGLMKEPDTETRVG